MADLDIGGQAVIEGVMMRGPDRLATAVRIPNGEIKVKVEPYKSLSSRNKVLGWPILRGAVTFAEMLYIGIRTLNFSADIAIKEAERVEADEKGEDYVEKEQKSNALWLGLSALFALVAGIAIFFFIPLAISSYFEVDKNAVWFNLAAGGIRLTMFVVYVWLISLFGEFKRVFQYHGAEHKSIYAYEEGDELVPERAALHTRFHPRCGTSFVLIVALLAVMVYAISDTIFTVYVGHPPALLTRFGLHMSLLPLLAGVSYELLKLSGRTRNRAITRLLIKPGLWLQKITTKEPSLEQLEVAIVALQSALGISESKIKSPTTLVS